MKICRRHRRQVCDDCDRMLRSAPSRLVADGLWITVEAK